MSGNEFWTLHLILQTQYENHLSMYYYSRLALPAKLYIHFIKALLFCLIYHTPIQNRGLSIDPRPLTPS
jgi:hypothetical protein